MIAPRTLYGKLLLVFLGFGALMTGVFLFVMRVSHETYHREFDQLVNRELAQKYVDANLLVREPPLTAHNFASSLARITAINPDIDVYVLDAAGVILAASAPGNRVVRDSVSLTPVARFLDGHTGLPLLGDDPADSDRREVFSAAPLSIPDCPAAYLYVVLNRHEAITTAAGLKTSYAIGEGVGVVLAATLLALGGSVVFLRLLTRRFGVLQESMERFRDSAFTELPETPPSGVQAPVDEIEKLRRMFVELAERVRRQMQELHATDDMRRELLANVSHDLRTPLATLQAHLETLSSKDDLTAAERRAYLAVTLQQCRRLIALVEQLLELAKLDAGQITISAEPFALAELAQDVAQKKSLDARRRGVALAVEPPASDLPLVFGDIALMERVLDNLVENALRFAGPGGRVTISLAGTADSVRLSVYDTGPGIPEGERGRIFDRFYRSDRSRPSESGLAGLGLSIARGILELHGQWIDLDSRPGEGTTFFFELATVPPDRLPARSAGDAAPCGLASL